MTRRNYGFAAFSPGDCLFVTGAVEGDETYKAAMRHNMAVTVEEDGLLIKCREKHRKMTQVETVRALIDWRVGAFANDLVTAADACETASQVIDGMTPRKMSVLLVGVLPRFKCNNVSLWAVRNGEQYQTWRASEIWRAYKNPA